MNEVNNKRFYFWGIGNLGEGFIAIITSTYLAIFLTDVALLPIQIVSAILLITSISDLVLSPLCGAIISAVKPMKWGRLRSWLLVGPPIATIFYILQFTTIPNNNYLTATIIIIGFVVAKIAWTLTHTANISLMNVLSTDFQGRNKLSSQLMIGSNAGRLIGNYLTPVIIAILLSNFKERYAYIILMLIAGIIYIPTLWVHFYITKGSEDTNQADLGKTYNTEKQLTLREMFKCLSTNGNLLQIILIDMTSNVTSLALPSLAVYYYKYVFQNYSLVPTHMLCIGLAGILGALITRYTSKFVKSKKVYLCTTYLLISIALFCTRFVSNSPYLFIGINIIIHMLSGTTQPYELGFYADNVIYTKCKTLESANSLIMGISILPLKLATVIKSVLISTVLMSGGYVANVKPTIEFQHVLINAYSLIPASIAILGFIILGFIYKLSDEKVKEMKVEIDKRENQK